MSRWTPRFSDSQREAILDAVLVKGLSARASTRAAAAGELEGTDAFTMSASTAAGLVRKHRDEYAVRDTASAQAALEADALVLARIAHRATRDIESKVAKGEDPDLISVKRAAEAITAAKRALGPTPRKPARADETRKHVEPDPSENSTGVLASLLAVAPTMNHNKDSAQPEAA